MAESLVEKVVLHDGSSRFLFNAKYTHFMDGRVLVGRAIGSDGRPLDGTVMVQPEEVASTVSMRMISNGYWEEDPDVVPPSQR